LQAALQIRTLPGDLTDEIEARILARESDSSIGARLGLPASAIAEYENAFFHVRDRLGARDWVRARVIGTRLPPEQDGPIIKLFAYNLGPLVLEMILPVLRRREFPKEIANTFANDAKYEDARLRILVRLTIAALRDASFSELANLIDVYEQARQVDMKRVDVPPLFKSDCRKYGQFFRAAHAANGKGSASSKKKSPSDEDFSKVLAQSVQAFRSLAGASPQLPPKRR